MADSHALARRLVSLALQIGVVIALVLLASAVVTRVWRAPLPAEFKDPRECFRDDDGEWIWGAMEYRCPLRAE